MTQVTVDRISIEELGRLYGIKQSTVYYRLNKLKLKPERTRDGSWITTEQRQVMDELNEHIKRGGTIDEFLRVSNQFTENSNQLRRAENSNQNSNELAFLQQTAWLALVEAIASRLTPIESDPLSPQEQLQRICDQNWLASTSQLTTILGIKSLHNGQERYGFRFHKAGRVGREAAWQITKKPTLVDREVVI